MANPFSVTEAAHSEDQLLVEQAESLRVRVNVSLKFLWFLFLGCCCLPCVLCQVFNNSLCAEMVNGQELEAEVAQLRAAIARLLGLSEDHITVEYLNSLPPICDVSYMIFIIVVGDSHATLLPLY